MRANGREKVQEKTKRNSTGTLYCNCLGVTCIVRNQKARKYTVIISASRRDSCRPLFLAFLQRGSLAFLAWGGCCCRRRCATTRYSSSVLMEGYTVFVVWIKKFNPNCTGFLNRYSSLSSLLPLLFLVMTDYATSTTSGGVDGGVSQFAGEPQGFEYVTELRDDDVLFGRGVCLCLCV